MGGLRFWRPPKVELGEYFQTASRPNAVACFGFSTPCREGPGRRLGIFRRGEFFGPVHEVRRNDEVITVCVPMWYEVLCLEDPTRYVWTKGLVWVNVYQFRARRHLAYKVRRSVVAHWKRHGWQDDWHEDFSGQWAQ